ncbi:hypothetical protein [Listeria seeligeri]|nr:hypothetical protein [Listeria seeligeri]
MDNKIATIIVSFTFYATVILIALFFIGALSKGVAWMWGSLF